MTWTYNVSASDYSNGHETLWIKAWLSEIAGALERLVIYLPLHRLESWGTGVSRVHSQLVGTFWMSESSKKVAPHGEQGLSFHLFILGLYDTFFFLTDENKVDFTFRHIWKREELSLARSLQGTSIQAGLFHSVPGRHCCLLCWLTGGSVIEPSNFPFSLFWKRQQVRGRGEEVGNLCGGKTKRDRLLLWLLFIFLWLACICIYSCTTMLQLDVGIHHGAVIMVITIPFSPMRDISICWEHGKSSFWLFLMYI